ncbi:MAG: ABC transporter permease subunit [Atopobiaceae bacterium]|nr:ABC transporter permease subunit [Atopobiaceae bacterium]
MNTAQKTDRIIVIVLIALAVGIVAWIGLGSGATSSDTSTKPAAHTKVAYTDYDGKKIGILGGTNMEAVTFEYFPHSEYQYYDGYPNLNAALEIGDMDFTARIPAMASGMYEFTNTMNVTREREEEVLFSDAVSEGGIVVAVRAEDLAGTQDAQGNAGATVASFDGKRAGVTTGSFHDSVVAECLPASEVSNYDTYTDLLEALRSDKIDYFLASTEVAGNLKESAQDIGTVSEPVKMLDIGAMFAKTEAGDKLKAQMDEFITKIKADGTLDAIYAQWSDADQNSAPVDMSGLTGEAGTLRFATSGTKVPVSFQVGDQIAGSDPDIAVRFCREYGYNIEVSTVNTAGIIPGITTGVYDFSLSDMVITAERQESVNFSVPYHQTELLLVARKADLDAAKTGDGTSANGSSAQQDAQEQPDFFQSIAISFDKNFIREDRWKLIVEGIQTTCLITALAVAFGSLLAFGICLFRRTGSRLANLVSDIFVRLLQGTPTVVLLMILYYVVFGRIGLGGVWVAVIGFTLNFGAYGSEIMRSGINSVDAGQREAALALGYTERQAFYDFIFPQAAVRFLPVLRGEAVSLLKSTSVVGYIAVQDLTKMSDIIRSRTYEAFFPLIATALIYFALAWLITMAVRLLLKRVDPRWGKRVKTRTSSAAGAASDPAIDRAIDPATQEEA